MTTPHDGPSTRIAWHRGVPYNDEDPPRCAYCDAAETAEDGGYCSPECKRLAEAEPGDENDS
jgi:hypothetical protein